MFDSTETVVAETRVNDTKESWNDVCLDGQNERGVIRNTVFYQWLDSFNQ